MIPMSTTTISVSRFAVQGSAPAPGGSGTGGSGGSGGYTGAVGEDIWGDDGDPAPAPGGGIAEPVLFLNGVRAHFSSPGFQDPDNEAPNTSMRLACDLVDLRSGDRVLDERTGVTYDVQWAVPRPGVMSHVIAQVWY